MASMVGIRNLVAGMSARERRLAAAMGVLAVGFAIFLVVFFVRSAIGDLEEENQEIGDLLRVIASQRDEYKARKLEESRDKTRSRIRHSLKPGFHHSRILVRIRSR